MCICGDAGLLCLVAVGYCTCVNSMQYAACVDGLIECAAGVLI